MSLTDWPQNDTLKRAISLRDSRHSVINPRSGDDASKWQVDTGPTTEVFFTNASGQPATYMSESLPNPYSSASARDTADYRATTAVSEGYASHPVSEGYASPGDLKGTWGEGEAWPANTGQGGALPHGRTMYEHASTNGGGYSSPKDLKEYGFEPSYGNASELAAFRHLAKGGDPHSPHITRANPLFEPSPERSPVHAAEDPYRAANAVEGKVNLPHNVYEYDYRLPNAASRASSVHQLPSSRNAPAVPYRARPVTWGTEGTNLDVDSRAREDLAARALAHERARQADIARTRREEAELAVVDNQRRELVKAHAEAARARAEDHGRYRMEKARLDPVAYPLPGVARETREDLAARALAHERARQANKERDRNELLARAIAEDQRRAQADAQRKRQEKERLVQLAQDANKRHSRVQPPEYVRPPTEQYDHAQTVEMAQRLLNNTARAPAFSREGSHRSGHDYRSREELFN